MKVNKLLSVSIAIKSAVGFFLMFAATAPAWSAIAIDQVKSTDKSSSASSVTSPSFSTTGVNELLLAFISTDAKSAGIIVTGVTGANRTWALVQRTNVQLGTAEIWRAFAPSTLSNVSVKASLSQSVPASITVVSFTGVDTSGTNGSGAIGAIGTGNANPGAPTASLFTTRNGSWVFGVGNDWDSAISRTLGPNQTMVHQYLATVGDTYWVQTESGPTLLSGTNVTINDSAPSIDRYNLSIVEILAAGGVTTSGYAVSGNVSPAGVGNGATLTLSGAGTGSVTADSSGNYLFNNLSNGTYTITPSQAGQTFTPPSQTITVNSAAVSGVNFAAVVYALTGTVSPSSVGSTSTMTLSGSANGTITPDSNGNYSFNVPNGTYTVTPSRAGYTFSPPSSTVTINGAPVGSIDFSAIAVTYSISGSITPTSSGVGAMMTLSGAASATVTADTNAKYTFPGLNAGTYTITPSKNGYAFTPGSQTVTIANGSLTGVNFTASAVLSSSSISGTVSPTSIGAGALVTLSPYGYAVANSNGNFSFTNLPAATYTVTVARTGYTFSPSQLTVVLNGSPSTGNNFSGAALPPLSLNYPDLSDIIPPSAMSIAGTGSSRVFQYTHDTLEGGIGPLEIQPVYNSASGNYQGVQHIYSYSNGTWTVAQSIPVAGAFVFDSAHGHFHFPFVNYGLYSSNADGSIGALVAASAKDGFCIDNSFIYDSLLANAGFGTWGSCSDPTSLRGLSIGAVDEYDQTDQGQAIAIGNLPDGTYWLRAIVDPNNYLAESDKSNNETDVQVSIIGSTLTVLQVVKPVLPPPPSVTMTAPTNNAQVIGTVQLAATTPSSGGTGMQFLVDGLAFGSVVSSSPYTLNWDTTQVPNGTHWLAAQYTNSSGIIGTSAVVIVNVANSSTTAPMVTITDPVAGSTLNAVVSLAATVGSTNPIKNVQFYVDSGAVGAALTAPPYNTFWDTESYAAGTHTVTATATDSFGNLGNAAPVSVMVDNSNPPNVIGIDAQVSTDGVGTMTSPAFSSTTNSDLLVAFVALDGPSNSAQTATVSGAGLTWRLLKRSNTQAGDAEIWAAKTTDFLTNATVIMQPSVGSGYHGSLVVVALANAAGPGIVGQAAAPSGAPDIYLPGVSAGNWVFAVGNDWDNGIARTPVSGQYLLHQRVDTSVGDTYWVQATIAPSTANALVDIHDSSPTTDRWNYAAVEIVATRQ